MRVVGFIRGRWVDSGAPWGSLGSSGMVGFTPVRPGDLWVHLGSFGSLGCAMGVVGFIRGRWDHEGAPLCLMGSSCVVGFTRVRAAGHCVYPGWLGSLRFALEVTGFIRGRRVHSSAPRVLWVHLGSFGSLGNALVALALCGSLGSSEVVGFTRVRHGDRWVHRG